MHIRLFPALIVLSLLALVVTACSVAQGAQPGPALAPEMTAIAKPAAAEGNVAQGAAAASCAKNACKKDQGTPSSPLDQAFTEGGGDRAAAESQAAAGAIAVPAEAREDSQGAVNVQVTPAGGTSSTLIFRVSMNTHSVELDYDMTKIAALTDDQGGTYPAKSWDGASGGHHRQGSLTFEVPAGAAPKSLELNLAGIGGVPSRLFKWDVK